MKQVSDRKGFSLVELLVVVGIVGLLSATFLGIFNSARKSSRDSLRIADLEQAEQALRLYYRKCGMYPGSFDASAKECEGGKSGFSGLDPESWDDLRTILSEAEIGGVSDIPNDPLPGRTYSYFVQREKAGETPRAQCYILKAELEGEHRVLEDDVDNADLEKLRGNSQTKELFPAFPECDDASAGTLNYCKGNLECFYGF